MSRASRRAARRELEAAKMLGTERVHRSRFQSAPDVEPMRVADGSVIQPEIKTRKRIPALIKGALAQAQHYAPSAIPLVIISETGGRAIACLPLEAFARLVGIREPKTGEQLSLLGRVEP